MNTSAAKREENVIYTYLRSMELEEKRRPMKDYMEILQRYITPELRGKLVDWLVEVAEEYKLHNDTLHLAVSYIDIFLSSHPIRRINLELLGVSSFYIASKYEDITPPQVQDLCFTTRDKFNKEEVQEMENKILKTLDFDLSNPTVMTFLRQESAKSDSYLQFEFLTNYLAELSLLDYDCLSFLPSLVAASVVFLARIIFWPKSLPWATLQEYSEYKPVELRECVLVLHDLHTSEKGASFKAIRTKYKQHEFEYVADLSSPPRLPSFLFGVTELDVVP
ncbi:carboxy-terminal domain cyclin [Medicago truncatula]|uniref:B-like cyclin n=1 Tax=Medicago truncatula TaxID=3880 RepID=A0A072V1R3_MEDTR|nr:carboxy-terminal domain cyclin [Medicago truncatula]